MVRKDDHKNIHKKTSHIVFCVLCRKNLEPLGICTYNTNKSTIIHIKWSAIIFVPKKYIWNIWARHTQTGKRFFFARFYVIYCVVMVVWCYGYMLEHRQENKRINSLRGIATFVKSSYQKRACFHQCRGDNLWLYDL